MNGVLYPICAAGAWLVAGYRGYQQRRVWRDPARVTPTITIVLLALTFTVATPQIWAEIDRLSGWPNLSALLSQAAAVLASASAQVAVLFWAEPRSASYPRVKRFLGILAIALLAMTVFFLLAPKVPERPSDFVAEYAGRPGLIGYLIVYALVFGFTQVSVTLRILRYARIDAKPWLRRGLFVGGLGSILGVVYCGFRMADIVAAHYGLDPHNWESYARVSVASGTFLVAAGFTLPRWGESLSLLHDWLYRQRVYRELSLLWRPLYNAVPEISLHGAPPDFLDKLIAWDLRYRVYRRVIEISDGLLILRPYMNPRIQTLARQLAIAAGLEGDDVRAIVEAAAIKAALRVDRDRTLPNRVPVPLAAHPDGHKLPSEIDWLIHIGHVLTSSPLVLKAVTEGDGAVGVAPGDQGCL